MNWRIVHWVTVTSIARGRSACAIALDERRTMNGVAIVNEKWSYFCDECAMLHRIIISTKRVFRLQCCNSVNWVCWLCSFQSAIPRSIRIRILQKSGNPAEVSWSFSTPLRCIIEINASSAAFWLFSSWIDYRNGVISNKAEMWIHSRIPNHRLNYIFAQTHSIFHQARSYLPLFFRRISFSIA